jgi:Protein of unknown function (DUF3987)
MPPGILHVRTLPAGASKTPGIDATKRALSQIERDRRSKIAEMRRAHEGRVEAAKAARASWKKEVESAADGKVVSLDRYRSTVTSEPVMPEAAVDPGPFVAPRLFVSNATIERLAVLQQARPQGLLMLSDELAGLFLNMSRYSGGQDNEFWLEAWNGSAYTVERMGRPPVSVDYLLIGVVGGYQPDKLARSFKGDLDGMYARVLFSWPVEPPYLPLSNDRASHRCEIHLTIADRAMRCQSNIAHSEPAWLGCRLVVELPTKLCWRGQLMGWSGRAPAILVCACTAAHPTRRILTLCDERACTANFFIRRRL